MDVWGEGGGCSGSGLEQQEAVVNDDASPWPAIKEAFLNFQLGEMSCGSAESPRRWMITSDLSLGLWLRQSEKQKGRYDTQCQKRSPWSCISPRNNDILIEQFQSIAMLPHNSPASIQIHTHRWPTRLCLLLLDRLWLWSPTPWSCRLRGTSSSLEQHTPHHIHQRIPSLPWYSNAEPYLSNVCQGFVPQLISLFEMHGVVFT